MPAQTLADVLDAMETGVAKSRLVDAIHATMNEAQRWVMAHWRGYVCEKCGHTMTTDGRSLSEQLQQMQDEG